MFRSFFSALPCFKHWNFIIIFFKKIQGGKINSVDFHRKDDLLVTASEDDSVRLYDIASAK